MNNNILVKISEILLEEAVLDTLYRDYLKNKNNYIGLGASDIGNEIGVYGKKGVVGMNDAIVTGILNKLDAKKCVEHSQGKWKLTQVGIDIRSVQYPTSGNL